MRTNKPARILQRLFDNTAAMTPTDARLYLMGCVGFPLGGVVHSVWAGLFWGLGFDVLARMDVFSALLWLSLSVLFITRRLFLSALVILLMLEVPIRALVATYYTGMPSAFWIYGLAPIVILPMVHSFTPVARLLLGVFFTVAMVATAALPLLAPPPLTLDLEWQLFFLITNIGTCAALILIILFVFEASVVRAEKALAREFDRAEGLLKNILPDAIALRLKNGEHLIADEHPEVSVIFADIVNFTTESAKLAPAQLVETLNLVFTEFDRLAADHGAEKIKTIGDSYMAVLGLDARDTNHADSAVALALAMLRAARRISAQTHFPIELRIGINSGSVVAGVIGANKFAYDLWGDAVNVAARMESVGDAGQVMITEATRAQLAERFDIRAAGEREVKGKGRMPVFTVS